MTRDDLELDIAIVGRLLDGSDKRRAAYSRIVAAARFSIADCEDAQRWRFFADSPQTALMLGSKLDPNDTTVDWIRETTRLADEVRGAKR